MTVWRRSDIPGPGIFDTPFGRIGGAICFDTFTREMFEGFKQSKVELIVLIGCWGKARLTSIRPDFLVANAIVDRWSPLAVDVVPFQYAIQLNVPIVFVNQGGITQTPLPFPPPIPQLSNIEYEFHGKSHIRNASGEVLVQANETEIEFCSVVPIDIKQSAKRPKITRVDIPARYLSTDYYFVQPPLMAKILQIWYVRGATREYEERCASYR